MTDTLTKEIAAPTHRVSVPRSHVFEKPSVASFKKLELSLNAQVCVTGDEKEWLELELGDDTGYVGKNVVQALTDCEGGSHTIITLAQRFTRNALRLGRRECLGSGLFGPSTKRVRRRRSAATA